MAANLIDAISGDIFLSKNKTQPKIQMPSRLDGSAA